MSLGFRKQSIQLYKSTAIATSAIVVLFLISACSGYKTEVVDSIGDAVLPSLRTLDVERLVSDSGYMRYKITTPDWMIFTKGNDPHWYFPKGLLVEKMDTTFQVEATVKADTVYYFEKRRLWKFIGHVDITNEAQDNFKSELLFYDEGLHRVYSDSFIHIRRKDQIIEGYGFVSNENMTDYVIRRSTAEFEVNDAPPPVDSLAVVHDSIPPQP